MYVFVYCVKNMNDDLVDVIPFHTRFWYEFNKPYKEHELELENKIRKNILENKINPVEFYGNIGLEETRTILTFRTIQETLTLSNMHKINMTLNHVFRIND